MVLGVESFFQDVWGGEQMCVRACVCGGIQVFPLDSAGGSLTLK